MSIPQQRNYYPTTEGRHSPIPGMSDIEYDVRHRDETFWWCGDGYAEVVIDGKLPTSKSLAIYYDQVCGFYIQSQINTGDPAMPMRFLNTKVSDDFARTCAIYVGGTGTRYPLAFFVDRDLAGRIVKAFWEAGALYDGVEWVDARAVGWDSSLHHEVE